jgi:hypothetical protein
VLKDCKATCDILVYKERENGYFYLQWYFGINKLVRKYLESRAPSLPTLTSEELDKQDSTCVDIVNFYQQPKRLQSPSLQAASLQQLPKFILELTSPPRPLNLIQTLKVKSTASSNYRGAFNQMRYPEKLTSPLPRFPLLQSKYIRHQTSSRN